MNSTPRSELFLSLIDSRGRGLEIGPGYNPLLPKSRGFNVETVDHATREELVHKYADANVDAARIEPVDHVVRTGSMFEAIGQESAYDYIVASHVIEHTPDMLGFLLDCQRLLKPSGVLVLAVPDKRFSFDLLRPVSSTGDVLQAHLEGRRRHTAGQVFDEMAHNVLRGGAHHWATDNRDAIAFFRPLADAGRFFDHVSQSDAYVDIHAWQFTPSAFRLVMLELHAIGRLALREHSFHDRGGEFIVSLTALGGGSDKSRLQLAQQAITELQAIPFLK